MSRAIAALARRVGSGDIDSLSELAELSGLVDDAIRDAVTGLRERGHTWQDIGAALGVTRQAACKRWG